MMILIVEDEAHIRTGIAEMLRDEGYTTIEAGSIKEGIALAAQETPDVILGDIHLPDGEGFRILHYCRDQGLDTSIMFMTAFGSRELAIQAISEGAYDYIAKPIRFDELFARLHRLREMRQLRGQVQRKVSRKLEESQLAILGDSAPMQAVRSIAGKAASCDAPVLITGETGVGKGLLAKLIHASSKRQTEPFVSINCASIPENLLESELFGYRKGAFTGADRNKKGLLEEAGDGTLFLDEIGEMPPPLQAKLLHVLDDAMFRPLGDTKTLRFTGRIVAATNIAVGQLLKGVRFREDLYYRLSVITIDIPPLRQRPEDLLPLAERIYRELATEIGRPAGALPAVLARRIQHHDWPGNVRELRNFLERALILGEENEADRGDAGETTLAEALRWFESAWIRRVIDECGGDKAEAAKRLDIGLSTLYRKTEG